MRAPSVLLFVCCVVLLGQQTPLDRAWALAANGHQTEAVQTLYQLIATQPENAEARLLLGSLLMEAGERDKSIEQLSAAVRLQPRSAQAQNALGEAYSKFSDNDSARAAFEKAVALQPDFGIAQLNLGQLLLTANELTPAAQHLDRAISLLGHTDDAAGAYYLRAKIDSAQSHFREAAAHLEQAVSLRPQFAAAWSDLGQARRAALDTKGALDAFKKAVQADPNDSIAQYRLGAEYLRQNQPHLAVPYLEKAYQLDPSDQSTLYGLQMALRQDGRRDEAESLKQKLAELFREKDQMNQNRLTAVRVNNDGANLEKAGNLRAALEKYREASQLDPNHAGIRVNYAVALLRLGQWKEGLDQLHAAMLRDPGNARIRAALKDALAQAPRNQIPQWGRDLQ